MLKAFTNNLAAYLHRRELLLLLTPTSIALLACEGRASSRQHQLLSQWQDESLRQLALPAQAQQLEKQLRLMLTEVNLAGRACRIVLADEWARYFIVTPASNTQSLLDCQASAQMRFQALFGETPSGWQIQAKWHASKAFLACALPQALLEMLHRLCFEAGRSIISLQTDLLACCSQFAGSLGNNNWLLHFSRQQVQIVVLHVGQVQALQSVFVDADFWQAPTSLQTLVQREALRLQLPLPPCLLLAGQYSRQWQTQIVKQVEVRALPNLTMPANTAASPALQLLHGVVA